MSMWVVKTMRDALVLQTIVLWPMAWELALPLGRASPRRLLTIQCNAESARWSCRALAMAVILSEESTKASMGEFHGRNRKNQYRSKRNCGQIYLHVQLLLEKDHDNLRQPQHCLNRFGVWTSQGKIKKKALTDRPVIICFKALSWEKCTSHWIFSV